MEYPSALTEEDSDHDGLDQATLQTLTQDKPIDSDTHASVECLKHVRHKSGTISFLPLDSKKGGNITYIKDAICLTEDQTRHVYKGRTG